MKQILVLGEDYLRLGLFKEWKINSDTAELEIDDLDSLLTDKTKILAVTHCSNIVGSVND